MNPFEKVRLYCFTGGSLLQGRDPVELVVAQIRGGADVIQLREKHMSKREKLYLGLQIRNVTKREGILFIVNDDLDLALILKADGVHLGQDDLPIEYAREFAGDMLIGVSTHNKSQVKAAVAAGADYIGIGPVFDTGTKKDHEPVLGPDTLAEIGSECQIPWVAIGGIGLDTIDSVVSAGGRAVAVISDILLADDVEARCKEVKDKLK
ncbi:MAG: thiamine phosphate synthase [Desulfatiglandaceae bacterium]